MYFDARIFETSYRFNRKNYTRTIMKPVKIQAFLDVFGKYSICW